MKRGKTKHFEIGYVLSLQAAQVAYILASRRVLENLWLWIVDIGPFLNLYTFNFPFPQKMQKKWYWRDKVGKPI